MNKFRITKGKFERLNACADAHGVIAAAAMDQRGSLQKSIAKARGPQGTASDEDLTRFKTAVTKVLTQHASAILMDPEFGLPALQARATGTGVLLAYEKTGYDVSAGGRLPDLLPEWSARRLLSAGADAVKVLLYYNPDDDPRTNTIKQALIERVGAECAALDVPFFLETLAYDDNLDANSLEFARRKPGMVKRSMEEFTRPEYGVDVLKVEVPFHPAFVEGMSTFGGTAAYNRAEALELYRQAASATDKPFIYLSAGVSDDVFREELEMAGEAGVRYNGVLCGRATWKEGIPVYAQQGYQALLDWLEDRGVQNITALNDVLNRSAHSWWEVYGGKENIEVIG